MGPKDSCKHNAAVALLILAIANGPLSITLQQDYSSGTDPGQGM